MLGFYIGKEFSMQLPKFVAAIVFFALALGVVLLGGAYVIPWQTVNWGKLEFVPAAVITVTGQAESQEKSQVAAFSAGVSSINDNKDAAIAEVNQKVGKIIESLKTFGIPPADIQTQNINVYQNEEQFYEDGRQKTRPGQWRVSNTVEVKLRSVDRSAQLADLLTSSGATNVYGPNFSMDDTKAAEIELIDAAITNARTKAEKVAASSSRKLGKIITVAEGYTTPPVVFGRDGMGGGGGAAIEPGSGTVSKTVTVTFQLL